MADEKPLALQLWEIKNGDLLAHVRAQQDADEDLTMGQLAHEIGVSRQTLWRWIRACGGRVRWTAPDGDPEEEETAVLAG